MTISELVQRLIAEDCIESDNLDALSLVGGELPPVKTPEQMEEESC